MKKITIFVDDDVKRMDIFPIDGVFCPGRYDKIIPNARKEGYVNQKVVGINVYRDEKKPAVIEETYFAIPTDDKVEKPNQKAIECLKEIYDLYEPYENDEGDVILTHNGVSFIEYIDNKIKELEEEE